MNVTEDVRDHASGRRSWALVAILSAALSAAAPVLPAGAVTDPASGQSRVAITSQPWQALLEMTDPTGDYYCGGVILSASTVATAAHCLYDDAGTPFTASAVSIVAGVSAFNPSTYLSAPQPGDAEQDDHAASLRIHPGFVLTAADRVDDVATITLVAPLDLTGPAVDAVPLVSVSARPAPGSAVALSGFGAQTAGANLGDGFLRTSTQTVADSLSVTGPTNALWLVSSGPTSVCGGDSGGPVVAGSPATLVGIIASASGCGPTATDLAADVSAPEIRSFLDGSDTPPLAPRGGTTADLTVAGDARPGATLTCSPGSWTGSPTYSYTFLDQTTGAALQSGPQQTYLVAGSTVGHVVACDISASNAGGDGSARAMHALTIGAPPPAPTPPALAPTPPATRLFAAGLVPGKISHLRGKSQLGITLAISNQTSVTQRRGTACVTAGKATIAATGRAAPRVIKGRLCWHLATIAPGRLVYLAFVVTSKTARHVTLTATVTGASGPATTATLKVRVPLTTDLGRRYLTYITKQGLSK
jgi:V8-like Glu-specific endopeptidase